MIRGLAATCALALASSPALACDLSSLVGYTLIAAKTVDGSIDKDGQRTSDFNGCDYDRVIVFDDGTGVACSQYGYQYAYRPKAYVFARGSALKLCVGSQVYEARHIR